MWSLLGQDTAAYARQRDELIGSLVKESFPDIKIIIKHGHNLYDPEEVVKKGNAGKAITTLMSWKKVSVERFPRRVTRSSSQ